MCSDTISVTASPPPCTSCPEEVIQEFYDVRLDYYEKRRRALIQVSGRSLRGRQAGKQAFPGGARCPAGFSAQGPRTLKTLEKTEHLDKPGNKPLPPRKTHPTRPRSLWPDGTDRKSCSDDAVGTRVWRWLRGLPDVPPDVPPGLAGVAGQPKGHYYSWGYPRWQRQGPAGARTRRGRMIPSPWHRG